MPIIVSRAMSGTSSSSSSSSESLLLSLELSTRSLLADLVNWRPHLN